MRASRSPWFGRPVGFVAHRGAQTINEGPERVRLLLLAELAEVRDRASVFAPERRISGVPIDGCGKTPDELNEGGMSVLESACGLKVAERGIYRVPVRSGHVLPE